MVILVLMINSVSAGFLSYFQEYSHPRDKTDSYKETTEFKKVTETNTRDYWNSETVKTTISEKTEISRTSRTPYYSGYYAPSYSSYYYNPVPYSSWRYKEPYNYYNYENAHYRNYYYKPRYDSELGYYNWRY